MVKIRSLSKFFTSFEKNSKLKQGTYEKKNSQFF
jgi:hypothetical protein